MLRVRQAVLAVGLWAAAGSVYGAQIAGPDTPSVSTELKSVSTLIVTTFSKLTVAQDFELRKTVRGSGARYAVVKNSLAERAAKGTRVEEALKNL